MRTAIDNFFCFSKICYFVGLVWSWHYKMVICFGLTDIIKPPTPTLIIVILTLLKILFFYIHKKTHLPVISGDYRMEYIELKNPEKEKNRIKKLYKLKISVFVNKPVY